MKSKVVILSILLIGLIYIMLCGYTKIYDESDTKVYDDADLLEKTEEKELEEKCIKAAKKMKLDIGIVTTDDTEGKSTMEYADDFYDENKFGFDAGNSGLILLIDMQNREFYISTCGIAIQYFNDDDIEDVLTALDEPMAEHDYYLAAETFVDKAVEHVKYINKNYLSEVKPWFDGDYKDYTDYANDQDIMSKSTDSQIEGSKSKNNSIVEFFLELFRIIKIMNYRVVK